MTVWNWTKDPGVSQRDPYFFGYGSLVNRTTHDFAEPARARLTGWRRAWKPSTVRKVAFLTAVPDPDCAIDGLIARVPGADWSALDEREWAYDRIPATAEISHEGPDGIEIAVYAVHASKHAAVSDDTPVLLSYIDVVVQGYLNEYGDEGARHFFDTTSGWDVPVLNDRGDPRYSRHRTLDDDERAVVDEGLNRLGVRLIVV